MTHNNLWKVVCCNVAFAVVLIAVLALPRFSVRAATLTVTNANDSGPGSLRDAIAVAANGDTITFGGDYTIYLNSQLDLAKTLTMDGSGHVITLSGDSGGDGSANVRVFNIAAGKVVTLSHLSVVKGNADMGGGIYNAGTLTLQDSVLVNNAATSGSNGGGAIWNESGTLTLVRTTVVSNTAGNNGGGILNRYGTVTLQNSTVSGNRVSNGWGGGINSINGSVILRNSTLSGNSALVNGGGTTNGGGLYHWGLTLALYNTLIANNTGGDCALTGGGAISTNVNNLIEDGSCNSNSVGFVSGDPTLGPLSDNGGQTLTHALLPGSLAIEAGNNATCLATDQRAVPRPQMSRCDIGAYEAAPQPVLRLTKSVAPTTTIAYVGGVVTYTLVVSNVSTVNDSNVMLIDMLPVGMNFTRWVINSGATVSGNQITWNGTLNSQTTMTLTFQATHSAGLTIVNTAVVSDALQLLQASATSTSPCQNTLVVSNGNDSGPGSLRQAIADTCAGGTITFAGDISTYLNSQLIIDKRLTIDGHGHTVTISGDSGNDGSANVRAFNISAGSVVTLSQLTITHCYDSDRGAGVYNSGTLNVISSTLSHNAADFGGAALNNNGGVLTVYSSTLSDNLGAYGGAVLSFNGTVLIQTSVLSGNSASNGGGAIYYHKDTSGSLTVLSSTLSENSSWYGGGIQVRDAPLVVQASLFLSNTAQYNGGGIYYNADSYYGTDATVTIDNSTFSGNVASTVYDSYAWGGGAIYHYRGTLTVRNSTFSGNSAPQSEGGGIVVWGSATLLNSTLISNTSRNASYKSGLVSYADLNMQNTIIAGGPGPDCAILGMVSVTNINNLVEDGSCSTNGVNFMSGDPRLGPLADNGGSLIGPKADTPLLTHALLPGSRAIDTGTAATCPTHDQRGIARPQLGGCDRGAVETRGFTLTLTGGDNQSTPINLAFPAPLSVTLRETGGRVLGGATITFTAPASGASLAAPTTTTRSTNADGRAALLPTANGTTGSYTVTASASGVTNVNFRLTNLKADTLTSVTSAPNPSTAGDVITFTATVTAVNGTPTGTVTFYDNAISLGSGTLDANGVATLTTASLSFGLHPAITATYAGSANYTASTSRSYTQTVKANTTTSMTSTPNPSQYGQVVTFTATVTSTAGTPTGTVTFYDNGLSLGSRTLTASSVATLTTTSLAAGTHLTITATYSGSANYNSSTSSNYAHTVNQANTTTSVTSAPNPSQYGQVVTFTATVTSSNGAPTGTVQFYVDSAAFGTPLDLSNGSAVLSTSALAVGLHPITATYSGNSSFNESNGGLSGGQVVNEALIAGLNAVNSSPTRLTGITAFTATITSGTNVSYTWDLGDGLVSSGAQVSHRYAQIGTYTATVTATNSLGSVSAMTFVTIEPAQLYLSLVLRY